MIFVLSILLSCSATFSELQPPSEGAEYLLLIAHGSGDTIDDWPADLAAAVEANLVEPARWDIWRYDWSKDAENKLTASGSGIEHGRYIADHLNEQAYTHYHLIGHSAGAFVVHTLEQELAAATIHSTYLDPFCGAGVFDWEYGHRNFGAEAHFAEAYINMDDGVPSTDEPLDQAFVFDVTAHAPVSLEGSERHWWPIDFYLQSIEREESWGFSSTVEAGHPPHDEQPAAYPKGEQLILE